jgi:hypothetical protein
MGLPSLCQPMCTKGVGCSSPWHHNGAGLVQATAHHCLQPSTAGWRVEHIARSTLLLEGSTAAHHTPQHIAAERIAGAHPTAEQGVAHDKRVRRLEHIAADWLLFGEDVSITRLPVAKRQHAALESWWRTKGWAACMVAAGKIRGCAVSRVVGGCCCRTLFTVLVSEVRVHTSSRCARRICAAPHGCVMSQPPPAADGPSKKTYSRGIRDTSSSSSSSRGSGSGQWCLPVCAQRWLMHGGYVLRCSCC